MKRFVTGMAVAAGIAGSIGLAQTIPVDAGAAGALPDLLSGQTFICDELETGEGTVLHTLVFTEDGYRLYNDNGAGIISEGSVTLSDGRALVFEESEAQAGEGDAGTFYGSYTGSAFEVPSVTLEYGGKDLKFEPDGESGEYVYLSYLGVFEGEMEEKPAVLILERWYEFYLYTDGALTRGTYEIYDDGRVRFVTNDQEYIEGFVEKSGADSFDIHGVSFSLELSEEGFEEEAVFTYAGEPVSYEAEHAMGAYTLSLYDEDVFVIRGVDGFVKAMGTMEDTEEGGRAVYFPRAITNEAELDERFSVPFTYEEDGIVFPASTYLLPRSGNIDPETGYGAYWSAGTILEFVRNTGWEDAELITYEPQDVSGREAPICSVLEEGERGLGQSMPSLGTARPLVLLIDFPDYKRPRFITAEGIEEALFDLENKDSLSAYYYRSSYGCLTIDGTVLDWYRTEKERGDYESDKEIMEEALSYYINEKGLDLSEYDADQDGAVDSLYVLWAGTLDNASGTWSAAYRASWKDSPEAWGTKVTGYIFVPGTTVWSSVPPLVCNVNSLTHETGHLLGLNDYYSYDTTDRTDSGQVYTGGALEGGLGGMDMMDVNVADHNAFSKWLLGWLDPQVVEYEEIASPNETEHVYTLRPSNEWGDAVFVKLKPSDSLYTELLVIEVVSPTMNAAELTRLEGPVVRILHVDASLDEENLEGNWRGFGFKFDNSYTSTKFISVVEADGRDEVLNYLPAASGNRISYDPADYFTAGAQITPNTYPNTNGYDAYGNAAVYNGLTITVESISETGEAVIRLGYEEQEDVPSVKEVTPKPAVVPHTQGEASVILAGTQEIIVTFDREIAWAGQDASERLVVSSGNQELDGYHIIIEGTDLKIVFDEGLDADRDYTVVIPAGILADAQNDDAVNNANSIFGFVTGA